jgi:hypothetical protein
MMDKYVVFVGIQLFMSLIAGSGVDVTFDYYGNGLGHSDSLTSLATLLTVHPVAHRLAQAWHVPSRRLSKPHGKHAFMRSGRSASMQMDETGKVEAIKDTLKSELVGGLTGAKPNKAFIAENLLALEGQNPTLSPATSPLLNGRWKFLYASGSSPGLNALELLLSSSALAPKSPSGAGLVDVADTYLTISPEQPRAKSEVVLRVLSFENRIKLASNLEVESDVRLTETYDFAQLSEDLDLRVPFKEPLEYKRSVLISYLDEDLMIVRDANGAPDLLIRVDDGFTADLVSEEVDVESNVAEDAVSEAKEVDVNSTSIEAEEDSTGDLIAAEMDSS